MFHEKNLEKCYDTENKSKKKENQRNIFFSTLSLKYQIYRETTNERKEKKDKKHDKWNKIIFTIII